MNPIDQSDRYAKWKELIDEQEKSGLSQTQFCKKHNLVLSKFGYYRGLIKTKNRNETSQKLFSAVQVNKSELKPSTEIRIVLPNGFQCLIPSHVDVSHVKRLMGKHPKIPPIPVQLEY